MLIEQAVDDEWGARRLAEEILDPRRTQSIVAVALSTGRPEPLVDVEVLASAFGAALWTLRTGPATWALKRRLPVGLDVFGDAVRIWRPGRLQGADHPLLLLHEGLVSARLTQLLRELVGRQRISRGLVSSVSEAGAVLELSDSSSVVVQRHQVSRHGLAPPRVLRVAQEVDVLLIGELSLATLLPLEPDLRHRLLVDHGPGSVVLGRLVPPTPTGDHPVELLPGVRGVVRAADLDRLPGWVDQDLVAVEVLDDDLALAPSPAGVEARAASLYVDGPPWLVPGPVAAELPPVAPPQHWIKRHDLVSDPVVAHGPEAELSRLDDVIDRASRVHDEVRALTDSVDEHVDRMRATAAELRHELEMDLVDLRQRVVRAMAREHDAATRTATEALESSRTEIRRLREALVASEADRDALRAQVADRSALAARHRAELLSTRAAVDRERERARSLQRELDLLVPAAERFRANARRSWLRLTTKADREHYPWRAPAIGPHFIRSLERLDGVGIDRVFDVCAELACGRATARPGLQVHALRQSSGAGSAQQTRSDGARAFRASLQVRSAAARRIHYWLLPDGSVELSQVGYHDDFSIR